MGQDTVGRQTKQTLIIYRQNNRGTRHNRETNKANIDNPETKQSSDKTKQEDKQSKH